jgi:short-subunit dehydrogenase
MATLSRPLAVVTGASSGIGFELARQFAEHGFDLVIAAEEPAIAQAAETLRGFGARVEAVQADLATPEGCLQLEQAADAVGKPLEVIALNAGVGVAGDFARETNLDDEINLIRLNVLSTVRLAKWASRGMVARGKGRICITSSVAGIMPTPQQTVYGASKAFDLSFAAGLQYELKDTGVTVTAVLPGPTDTEFFRRAGMEDTKFGAEKAKDNPPAEVARQAYEALMAGKDRVAAGNFSVKMQGMLSRFMPESVKAAMHEKMAEHGSADKDRH